MNRIHLVALAFAVASALPSATANLEEVASFPDKQITGVAVSKTGRVFVNFPHWSDDHTFSVAEIVNGQPKPFPNEEWNKPGPAATHFICVQSVYVDANDNLWILDPASPKMEGTLKDGPKLVQVDLAKNESVRIIPFGDAVAPKQSYLNDIRVDTETNTAYITESGKGAIIVVNLNTGKARRLLDGHKSTQAETGVKLAVDGRELLDKEKKTTPQIAADGIALDSKNDYLYYHALTGRTLYRIKTAHLRDEKLSSKELESKVENAGQTPAPDGMIEAPDGGVYLTAIEQNAIVRWDSATKKVETVIEDERLSWPDTLSWGPGGALYVACSQIQNMARFNEGKSARTEPYKVFKIRGAQPQ
jgi:sugar lactone lactonase YvrE